MLRQHYAITTDVARVYKVRARMRHGWGWAVATIREWPKGGQIDVQSDFGNFAYGWSSIGDKTLREFLCGLSMDYFMNKASPKDTRIFDEEATIRGVKKDIFERIGYRWTREEAHEARDDLDQMGGTNDEHAFAERLMQQDWYHKVYDGDYPDICMHRNGQHVSFWEGPWQALRDHWKAEVAAERKLTDQPTTV